MLIIGNGRVITRDRENRIIEQGAVVINGSIVEKVGEYSQIKEEYPHVETVDAHGGLIMPGLINGHHHIYSAFARGLALPGPAPDNFLDILDRVWWNIDRKLNLEQTYYSGFATFTECIRNGVTTVIDHHASYGHIKDSLFYLAKAAYDTGMRSCLAYEISDRDGQKKMQEAVDESIRFDEYTRSGFRQDFLTESYLERFEDESQKEPQDDSMLKALIGLHASFTLSDETLDYIKSRNMAGTGYHIHVAEGLEDEEHAWKTYGCSVVERLEEKGILGDKTLAGHCVHISDEDMDTLKKNGTRVVHNPQSNMGNAVGSPDVWAMLDKGIPVGLGTDGFTSDMLESVKFANLLQKHSHSNPVRGFTEAVDMLLKHNRQMAETIFGVKLGCIEEGAKADIITLDYTPYTPLTEQNINGHLLFGLSGAQTRTTVINGKVLMQDRILKIKDNDAKFEESRRVSQELWSSLYE